MLYVLVYMFIYTSLYLYIHIYEYIMLIQIYLGIFLNKIILKYNTMSPYNITFISTFRAALWYWTTNWCTLPWGESLLPLPVLLCCLKFFLNYS